MNHNSEIKTWLDQAVLKYNRPNFIQDDPISLPHRFSRKQDIEIIGFWVAMLAWGRRKTIIQKGIDLIERMDHAPYDFIKNHQEKDRKKFLDFKHRTFQPLDSLYFLHFLQFYYRQHDSLEHAFAKSIAPQDDTIEKGLVGFHQLFFSLPEAPDRTRKHVPTPLRKSTCKRLNMFLRWMVRQDTNGVDFGLWSAIQPRQLLVPFDVHVEKTARQLGLIQRKQRDWRTVLELTGQLRQLDPADPVKYDYALFGLSVNQQ